MLKHIPNISITVCRQLNSGLKKEEICENKDIGFNKASHWLLSNYIFVCDK